MTHCCRLLAAFSELLQSDSENAAPNRLLFILQPNHEAHWVIDSNWRADGDNQQVRKKRIIHKPLNTLTGTRATVIPFTLSVCVARNMCVH